MRKWQQARKYEVSCQSALKMGEGWNEEMVDREKVWTNRHKSGESFRCHINSWTKPEVHNTPETCSRIRNRWSRLDPDQTYTGSWFRGASLTRTWEPQLVKVDKVRSIVCVQCCASSRAKSPTYMCRWLRTKEGDTMLPNLLVAGVDVLRLCG